MKNDVEGIGRLAVNLNQAGQLLGVSRWAVRVAIADGRIPAVRIGRRVVISVEALKRFLERNEGADKAA